MSEKLHDVSFYKYLISNGYYFNKELIENYLLSLKVKPFEILTGNSGTGKTKLSQMFAKFLYDDFHSKTDSVDDDGFFTIKVKSNYSSWENQGWTLSKDELANIIPIEECGSEFDMLIDGMPAKGNLKIMVQLYYEDEEIKDYFKKLYDENPNGLVDLKISCRDLKQFMSKEYIEPNGKISLKQKSNQSAFEKRQWFAHKTIFNYYPFDSGYSKCNIIVNGIKSSAKIRITPKLTFKKNNDLQHYLRKNEGKEVVVELKIDEFKFKDFIANWECSNSRNLTEIKDNDSSNSRYKIVPVGANWTDNTNILGYFNVITEQYQSTPAYELIKQAQDDSYNPYFLILDEMNLSHVERYFADFLSAIESGEEIPLYGDNETLKLPENLFIIGTVNVDETTYMFSPKVLDRANTIEFDTIHASDYMSLDVISEDFNGDIDYLQSPLSDKYMSELNIQELKDILSKINCYDGILWDVLAGELTEFQVALKDSGFDFGFRVINEILRFMIVAWKYENSPDNWDNWERYFDAQIKQKILPKLHGSEKAIGNVLTNLFNLCLNDRNNNENPKNSNIDEDNCKYYSSALKLQTMSKVLSDQRYVSFIN